jgi:hypothetical protein
MVLRIGQLRAALKSPRGRPGVSIVLRIGLLTLKSAPELEHLWWDLWWDGGRGGIFRRFRLRCSLLKTNKNKAEKRIHTRSNGHLILSLFPLFSCAALLGGGDFFLRHCC